MIRKSKSLQRKLNKGYEDLPKRKSKLSTNRKRASVSQVVRVVQVKAIKLPLRLAKIRASTFSAKDFPWWTHTVLVGVGNVKIFGGSDLAVSIQQHNTLGFNNKTSKHRKQKLTGAMKI